MKKESRPRYNLSKFYDKTLCRPLSATLRPAKSAHPEATVGPVKAAELTSCQLISDSWAHCVLENPRDPRF